MNTRVNGASRADHCQCALGFYAFFDSNDNNASVVDGNKDAPSHEICRQIPIGYYKPDSAEIPEKCPRSQTTLRAKSLSKTECICAPGSGVRRACELGVGVHGAKNTAATLFTTTTQACSGEAVSTAALELGKHRVGNVGRVFTNVTTKLTPGSLGTRRQVGGLSGDAWVYLGP